MSSTLREASKDTLQAKDKTYHYYSLPLAAKSLGDITRLPKSLKVLLENLLRWQDGNSVTEEDIHALAGTAVGKGAEMGALIQHSSAAVANCIVVSTPTPYFSTPLDVKIMCSA